MHPASFRLTQGTIRTTKGSAIANLVSLEVHVFRYVARKIYSYKTCLFSVVQKNAFRLTHSKWFCLQDFGNYDIIVRD